MISQNIKDNIRRRFPKIWKFLTEVFSYYLRGTLNLLIGKKADTQDYWARCREVCIDPNNKHIPRVKDAGKIIDGNLIMHNGLKVKMGEFAYCSDFAYIILTRNRGVHEPQEERVFREVLGYMPENATMIELGSYWAFYSMWFKKEIKNANCYMIEPEEKFLLSGKENFKLNNMDGTFIKGGIGKNRIHIDDFIEKNGIETVHILHSDIQGVELEMLHTCEQSIGKNKIWYFFISSHTQKLHYQCMHFLKNHGYAIVTSADFDFGTYCYDGVLVARRTNIKGMDYIEIPLRRNSRYQTCLK